MDFVGRKIERAKWETEHFMTKGQIGADALTRCLRTTQNTLSLWLCEGDKESMTEVVLAIAATRDHVEAMHVIAIPTSEVEGSGFVVEQSEGRTPVADLTNRHIQVIELTSNRLCDFADILVGRIRGEENCHLFSKREVLDVLIKAIETERLSEDDLQPNVKTALAKYRQT